MDQEVAKTLGELELKLQELERELTTIGRHEKPAEPPHSATGRLIDEAVERAGASDVEEQAIAGAGGFGGPAPDPSPPDLSPDPSPDPSPPDPSPPIPPPAPQPPSAPPPAPTPPPGSPPPTMGGTRPPMGETPIERAELLRFRDKMASTMEQLLDEYSRLISTNPAPLPRADA